jgi:membrane protease YdiL (CAAX protease family)
MKGFFANRSALFQASILLYMFLAGFVTVAVAINLFTALRGYPPGGAARPFYEIQALQFFSCALSLLLPALVTAYLCSRHPEKFLYMRRIKDVRIFVLTFLMVFLLSPAIDLTSYLNSNIHLPEFMAPLERLMRETEEQATRLTESLLSEKGVAPFIVNIAVIAVMAGIAEEFIFRGAILRIIGKKIKNPHVTIWIVAAVFSAIHLQFYGFIPRMLLGAFLGYLLYWSKSIWLPVFAHFLNNAAVVTANYAGLYTSASIEIMPAGKNADSREWMAGLVITAAGLFLFALCAKSMKRRCAADEGATAFSCEVQSHGPDISRERSH